MRNAFGLVLFAVLCASSVCGALTVDYYQSGGQTLGIAHSLVVSGDGDRNGPDSSVIEVEGFPPHVPDGIPDAAEGCLFEYCYDHPDAPYHDEAVAAWDQNVEAMWQLAGPHEGGAYAWGWDAEWADGGSSPPYVFPEGDTMDNALNVRNTFYITVCQYSYVGGNAYWALANWFFMAEPERRAEAYDFDSDPNFTRAVAAYFGSLGDLDGDGLTNLEEWNNALDEWRTLHDESPDPEQDPVDWPNEIATRAEKDEIIGMYIEAAVTGPVFEVTRQPAWGMYAVGEAIVLSFDLVGGSESTTYQWTRNGEDVPGATDATLTISSAELNDAGTYLCEITEGGMTIATEPVGIIVGADLPAGGKLGAIALCVLLAALSSSAIAQKRSDRLRT